MSKYYINGFKFLLGFNLLVTNKTTRGRKVYFCTSAHILFVTSTRRMNLENNGEISSTLIRKNFQFQKICCQTRKYVVFNIIIMIFFYNKW